MWPRLDDTLLKMCLRTVAQNLDLLQERVIDLPVALLKDLMPLLDVIDLDRIEKAASLKGVSSSLVWANKWAQLNPSRQWKFKFMHPDKDWKQKCLQSVFHSTLFEGQKIPTSLSKYSDHQLLSMSAKYVRALFNLMPRHFSKLASKEMRPVLSALEEVVKSIRLFNVSALVAPADRKVLFVVHRLLDHGCVRELNVMRVLDSSTLRWITSRCSGIYSVDRCASEACSSSCEEGFGDWEEGPSAPKCPRLDSFGKCSRGQIHTLDVYVKSLNQVSHYLPSWLCLRSLQLHVEGVEVESRWEKEVTDFVESLRKLFQNPLCSLRDLSISNFCGWRLWTGLLTACSQLHSLSLEFSEPPEDTWTHRAHFIPNKKLAVSLEKLSLTSTDRQATTENFPDVLQLIPKLRSLEMNGIPNARHLLHSLREFNPPLKVLTLKDMNLAECHEEIIHLLESFEFEELNLRNCRLLEKCSDKKNFLVLFVAAVRKLDSLQTLSLSQNRLATDVMEIADLFSGDSPSKITTLDLSFNFILPADLLEFSKRLQMYRPPQRLMLDLRCNPFCRDFELQDQAMKKLLTFCNVLTENWDFRWNMADHVSVM